MPDRNVEVRSRRGRSLQFRLVLLISSILVVMVAVIGTVSIVVQNDSLIRRIDEQLEISRGMAAGPDGGVQTGDFASPPPASGGLPSSGTGTDITGDSTLNQPDLEPGTAAETGPAGPRFGSLDVIVIGGLILRAEAVTSDGETVVLDDDQIASVVSATTNAIGPETVRLANLGSYRVLANSVTPGVTVIVGQSLQEVRQTTRNLSLVFGITAVVGVAFASAGAALLVRRELRPLESLRRAAAEVSETSLTSGPVTLPPRVPAPEFSQGTEVGDLSESFNQMMDHVEDSLRQREISEDKLKRFAADASHELRTPLATVSGYAEFATRQGGDLPPDVSLSLGRIRSESARMAQIIEDLLLLARLDNGDARPAGVTQVAPTILETVADARVIDPQRTWRVDLAEDGAEWAVPIADTDLRRILANLLANARTHTPTDTPVTVTLTPSGPDAVSIAVTDQGPGIDPGLLPHVFDRFVRGDSARTPSSGSEARSTGLGLAITKELVEAAGGSIAVHSRPGLTVFALTLPRDAGQR